MSLRPAGYLGNVATPDAARGVLGGVLAYPLPAGFTYRWISAEDQARLVVAAFRHADRASLAGRSFAVGQLLTGAALADAVGQGLGRPVAYKALTPLEFRAILEPVLGPAAGPIAEDYQVIAESPDTLGLKDDPEAALSILGVQLSPVADWAARQPWQALADGGSSWWQPARIRRPAVP